MAKAKKLSDLSIKRARPESSEEVKGGKTKFTLGAHGSMKSATIKTASARASARRSRPD